jgi:hypothetical protein
VSTTSTTDGDATGEFLRELAANLPVPCRSRALMTNPDAIEEPQRATVLSEILGLRDDEITELMIAGAIEQKSHYPFPGLIQDGLDSIHARPSTLSGGLE